ncbi:MAG TPA: MBL fold metallo-hydrolase [Methanoregulaceae archaeon]|nr:MBL fold metallo-hydrolase [Methanoregulaceae archaeon]
MRCITLASGSKGNCTYIEGTSSAILIDAGHSVREIFRRMHEAGVDPALVNGIIVTHEHSDHVKGLLPLARRLGVPVFGTGGTLSSYIISQDTERNPVRFLVRKFKEPFMIDEFTIEAFPVSHDAREPCGFFISDNHEHLGYCTDTGIITDPMMEFLSRSDAVVLESNHCPEMLKNGPYPEMLKRRIRSRHGHLSNIDAAKCIAALGEEVFHIRLAHLSEINNTPDTALRTGKSGLGLFRDSVKLTVAAEVGPEPCWAGAIRF